MMKRPEFLETKRTPRYSLRKLNVGVASVLLGVTIFGINFTDHSVKAATTENVGNFSISANSNSQRTSAAVLTTAGQTKTQETTSTTEKVQQNSTSNDVTEKVQKSSASNNATANNSTEAAPTSPSAPKTQSSADTDIRSLDIRSLTAISAAKLATMNLMQTNGINGTDTDGNAAAKLSTMNLWAMNLMKASGTDTGTYKDRSAAVRVNQNNINTQPDKENQELANKHNLTSSDNYSSNIYQGTDGKYYKIVTIYGNDYVYHAADIQANGTAFGQWGTKAEDTKNNIHISKEDLGNGKTRWTVVFFPHKGLQNVGSNLSGLQSAKFGIALTNDYQIVGDVDMDITTDPNQTFVAHTFKDNSNRSTDITVSNPSPEVKFSFNPNTDVDPNTGLINSKTMPAYNNQYLQGPYYFNTDAYAGRRNLWQTYFFNNGNKTYDNNAYDERIPYLGGNHDFHLNNFEIKNKTGVDGAKQGNKIIYDTLGYRLNSKNANPNGVFSSDNFNQAMEFKSQGVTDQSQFSSYKISFTTQHTDSHEVELTTGPKNQQFSGIAANIYSFQNKYYNMFSSLYGEQRALNPADPAHPDAPLTPLNPKDIIPNWQIGEDALAKINKDYLNNAQINALSSEIHNNAADPDALAKIVDQGNALNAAMKNLGNSIGQYDPDGRFAKYKEDITKASERYKYANPDKKAAYDNATEVTKALINKDTGTYADQTTVEKLTEAEYKAWHELKVVLANKITPKVPSTKEPVANTSHLTDGEKAKVQKNVEDANKDENGKSTLPDGTTVTVGDDGTATVTYPDKTTDTIQGSDLVRPATDAEKTTPKVPSTKEPVANTSHLTDGEKAKVQKNVEDANKDENGKSTLPDGTTVTVGDDGTATVTYPDKTTDTIQGSDLVRPATDAEKTTPKVPSTKEPVANTSHLTDGEKAKVQKNVEDANKDENGKSTLPDGTTVTVGDDGTATVTYPDKTTDTIQGSDLVRPATDAEKTTPKVPSTKEPVANTSHLTDGEKAKVQKNVEDANKDENGKSTLPDGTTVTVGDDGTATVTYPDKTTDTIQGSDLVRPATDAEKTTPKVPSTKEPVANTSHLTDGEKAKVQKNVEDANKDENGKSTLPDGTTVTVGDDGTATVTYPDKTTDTIQGSDLVRPATDAEKTTPKVPSTKEPVANTSHLTDGEKAKVQKNVEDANKDENGKSTLPDGTTVTVGDDGTATVTYPDKTTDTIQGSDLVRPATDAEKTTPKVPSTKEPVANTSHLTDGEKAKVQKNVEDANKDENGKSTLPDGTTVTVDDKGNATVTYPDGSKDTIPGDQLVQGQKGDTPVSKPEDSKSDQGKTDKGDTPVSKPEDSKSDQGKTDKDDTPVSKPEGNKSDQGKTDKGDTPVSKPEDSKSDQGKTDKGDTPVSKPEDSKSDQGKTDKGDTPVSKPEDSKSDQGKTDKGDTPVSKPEDSKSDQGKTDKDDTPVSKPEGNKSDQGKTEKGDTPVSKPEDSKSDQGKTEKGDTPVSKPEDSKSDQGKTEKGDTPVSKPEDSKSDQGKTEKDDTPVSKPEGNKSDQGKTEKGDTPVSKPEDSKSDQGKTEKGDTPVSKPEDSKSDQGKTEKGDTPVSKPEDSKSDQGKTDKGDTPVSKPEDSKSDQGKTDKDDTPVSKPEGNKSDQGKTDKGDTPVSKPEDSKSDQGKTEKGDTPVSKPEDSKSDQGKTEKGDTPVSKPEDSKSDQGKTDKDDTPVSKPEGNKSDQGKTEKGDTTDAGNITPTVPGGKVTVKDPSHLTDDEKKQVKNNVDNANKDKFPAGTTVEVGDDGTATVTYPDGSKDTIPGDQLVQGQKGSTTDAGNITPTVPGGKVTVKDPSHLTDNEKKQVQNNVDNANKDKFPAGTKVTVGDDGTATVNYPDGSKDTIPGDQLVQGQKGDTTDAGNITPTVPGDKVTVKDPSHLTDDEKNQVKNNVDNANKDKFPAGTKVTVGDDGTATVNYPDGSKDTIPGDQLVQGQKGDTTDAGNITPTVPGDKVTVKDPSHLTDDEKNQVKNNVDNANKDKFPAGTKVTVGDDGTATVNYPDGSKDTIPGDQLVQGQKGDTTDAGNITPTVPGDKVTVKDPSHLTDDEKNQVKNNVDNANKDKFPAGTKVTVGDDGTATVNYPDGSKDTIPGDQLVQGQKGDTTDAGNITPTVPGDKVTVKDPSHLTDDEKNQVKNNVDNANKDKFPDGTKVTVGDDGTATVNYPDGSKDTIPGDQLVQGQKGDTTDAGNITPTVPGDKVTVKDPSHLTDDEKNQVKNNVDNANKDKFPAGTKVTVGDDGTATVNYPDGSKDTIPGDQLVQGQKGDTTDAGNITPTVPGDKVTVKDPSHLTDDEKNQVKNNVDNANKDKFPAGTKVTVGDDGTATVNYPDGSKDTIPGDQLVQGQKGDTTDAGNITPTVPGDKVTVKDPSHLTDDEKNQVKNNVDNANKDKFPDGTKVTVGDDGTATVNYPDGSKDTIPGDQLVQGQKGDTTDAGNITPTVPGDKVTVKDPSHLTDDEKNQVKNNVDNANKDKFPAGTKVTVGDDGTATVNYPDGSKDTIPGDQLVQGQKGDTTDAGNITPTVPGDKVTVKDPSHLTDDEKNQVKNNVDNANKDKFPAGTKVTVGDDGTATVNYPDGSKDTIPGDQLVQGQKGDTTDAGNITPTVPGDKVTVKDPSHLTDDEKNQVKNNVDNANKDKFPAGTKVTVGDDGTATVNYPDGSKDTIPGDQLVQGQKGDTTDAGNITPTVPGDKVTVKDPSHLTDDEKNQVKNNVDNANKDKFPAGTKVTVGDDGTATVNYPDGSKDTIPGDQLVQGQKGDTTDAGNITPTVPGDKVTVKDPSHLTDDEKNQVKNNVDNANKDKFPAGTKVTVGDDGTATVNYPDGSKDTIPGDQLVQGQKGDTTDAGNITPTVPGDKVTVKDPSHLTDDEKNQVKNNVDNANKDKFPDGTKVTVGDDGTATVNYPDGSKDTIPGDQLVQGQKGDTTDAGNITPTVPGDKVTVKDPSHLTDDEKNQVKNNVDNANKDNFPSGTKVTVGDDGTATVNYPDGSKDTIPGDQLVQGQKGSTTDAGNITPTIPGGKVTVKDPSHLTDGEKDQVKNNVDNANKDKFPAGTEVTVGDDGTATVTYPDGSTNTIPGHDLVTGKTDADKYPLNPGQAVDVVDPNHLTQAEQDQVKEAIRTANPTAPIATITVDAAGNVQVTFADGSTTTLQANLHKHVTEATTGSATKPGAGTNGNQMKGATSTNQTATKQQAQQHLPQTGDQPAMWAMLSGLGVAFLGLLGLKKKRED